MTREFTVTAKLQGFMEAQAELISSATAARIDNTAAPVAIGINPPSAT